MRDLIIFEIDKNLYGLNLELIQRIVQVPEITAIPDGHKYIDGMMSYEGKVIKVLNFRKMTNMPSYEGKLRQLFEKLKEEHKVWIDALTTSVVEDVPFTQPIDPNKCGLGKWMNAFTSYDEVVTRVFKKLQSEHVRLHESAQAVLKLKQKDEEEALKRLQTDVMASYENTISYINQFVTQFEKIGSSMQKLLIYQSGNKVFGIKVDAIADIASIDDTNMRPIEEIDLNSKYIEIDGVIEIDNKLVNIIRSIKLPTSEVA